MFIIVIVIVIAFVFPNSNAYLYTSEVNGEKKSHYSFIKTYQINKIMDTIEFENKDMKLVEELHTITFGEAKLVNIDGNVYDFYRAKNDDEVIVTKSRNESENVESYAIIKEDKYEKLAKLIEVLTRFRVIDL